MGVDPSARPILEPAERRLGLCLAGEQAEPLVSAETLSAALVDECVEHFRPLLPVGYTATALAYRDAATDFGAAELTHHYTVGLEWFHSEFVPQVKAMLQELSGFAWDFRDHMPYAAGSDVDFIAHIVNASSPVCVFPGDWYGFRAGASRPDQVTFGQSAEGSLACLCVPSVRNGHITQEMLAFLDSAETCLLNINLYPTLSVEERRATAEALVPLLPKSIVSISFSRGFGLTGSQLGLVLVPRDHPMRARHETQWNWFTYFYNAIAARAFLRLDLPALQRCDEQRRIWVNDWLLRKGLPAVDTGSYYVKSFSIEGEIPEALRPLMRDGLARLCFKPTITD